MKIRRGFVSNSSSSSYIIALKKPINEVEIETIIMKHFVVSIDSIFWDIAKDIAEYFAADLFHYTTVEDLENEYFLTASLKKRLGLFKHFYHGEINNYDGGLGEFISDNIAIRIDNEDMYMYFDGMF